MIDRRETRCMVLSCKFNRGDGGTLCDFALYGHPCGYTPRAAEWHDRGGLACFTHLDNGNGRGPHSLTWRADQARRTGTAMTMERARQLALEMEIELSEVER